MCCIFRDTQLSVNVLKHAMRACSGAATLYPAPDLDL